MAQLGWVQVSTGNLCRWHIAERTEIGLEIDFAIKSGKLVSDDLISSMVAEKLHRLAAAGEQNVILDGYPRTVPQAKNLYDMLENDGTRYLLRVVLFEIDRDEVVARLASRLVCSNSACQAVYSSRFESGLRPKAAGSCDRCGAPLVPRKDDLADTIVARIDAYEKHVAPLLAFYAQVGQRVLRLDAAKAAPEVFAAFKKIVGLQD